MTKSNKYIVNGMNTIIKECFEANLNPLKIISNIEKDGCLSEKEVVSVCEALSNFLDNLLMGGLDYLKSTIIRMTLYKNIKSSQFFYQYMCIHRDVIKEMIDNKKSDIHFVSIDDINKIIKYDDFTLVKECINNFNKKDYDLIIVLSSFLNMKKFIQLKSSLSEEELGGGLNIFEDIFSEVDEYIKKINLNEFVESYIHSSNEENFRICFEYILSIESVITDDMINIAIANKKDKPFLIASIGDFCDLNEMIKILIMLVLTEYKDKLIYGIELREIISQYIDEIFQYNYLINEYDFTNVCFLMFIEKHLNMFDYIKSINNYDCEGCIW